MRILAPLTADISARLSHSSAEAMTSLEHTVCLMISNTSFAK